MQVEFTYAIKSISINENDIFKMIEKHFIGSRKQLEENYEDNFKFFIQKENVEISVVVDYQITANIEELPRLCITDEPRLIRDIMDIAYELTAFDDQENEIEVIPVFGNVNEVINRLNKRLC